MTQPPGRFVWFEHVSNDVPAARRFYDTLFDWRSDAVDVGSRNTYHMIVHNSRPIGGYRTAPAGVSPHWQSYLSVTEVDGSAQAALAAGGKVLMPPTDFPPLGRGACLSDPGGSVFWIWKSSEDDLPIDTLPAAGDWCWNELPCPDPDAAVGFYTRAFGFRSESTSPDGAGTYHLLKVGEVDCAGIMRSPMPGQAPQWLPYVAVVDPDATARKAAVLGARTLVEPRTIEGVGRFAVFLDPLGAMFGVFRCAAID